MLLNAKVSQSATWIVRIALNLDFALVEERVKGPHVQIGTPLTVEFHVNHCEGSQLRRARG